MSSRQQRRARIALENKAQKSGNWGNWEYADLPFGAGSSGWPREFLRAARNNRCAVMFRELEHPVFGKVTHLMISTIGGSEPTWKEKQRLKNELLGEGFTAIEIMPPEEEVVDEADAYHIWAFSTDLGLSLFERADS